MVSVVFMLAGIGTAVSMFTAVVLYSLRRKQTGNDTGVVVFIVAAAILSLAFVTVGLVLLSDSECFEPKEDNMNMNGILPAVFAAVLFTPLCGCGSARTIEPTGHWEGTISFPGQGATGTGEFGLELDVETDGSGYSATVSIPEQGLFFSPAGAFEITGGTVRFEMRVSLDPVRFEGKLAEATDNSPGEGESPPGPSIQGTWLQGSTNGKFRLTRTASEPHVAESFVEPEYRGRDRELILETGTGSIYGTLCMPPDGTPAPGPDTVAVLIIAGSGPTDRDGNSHLLPGKNNSLKMLAHRLAENGIPSIRYDKRGIAASGAAGGREEDLVFDDYVRDAVGWIGRLTKESGAGRIAVIGHSEGSLIGMLAAEETGADGFVSIAGAGRPIRVVLEEQLAKQGGYDLARVRAILDSLARGEAIGDVDDGLRMLFRPSVQPYLRSWMRYDPAAEIAKLTVPVLVVQGGRDTQTTLEDARLLTEQTTPGSGIVTRELFILENMNHVLKEVGSDKENLVSYAHPGMPIPDAFVEKLVGFLQGL